MKPFRISELAVVRVFGGDASRFLQNQLSADVATLSPGDCTFACYCNPKGQVWALLLVIRTEAGFELLGTRELMPALLPRLRMFVMRDKVSIESADNVQVVGMLMDQDASAPEHLYRPADTNVAYRLLAENDEHPATDINRDDWIKAELNAGIWWLDEQSSQQFIPQMLGYDALGAVSFSKGCYPGQEIVARARYLGKVKRGPVLCHLPAPLPDLHQPGLKIRRGEDWQSARPVQQFSLSDGSACLLVVASRESEDPVLELKRGDERYRCATM